MARARGTTPEGSPRPAANMLTRSSNSTSSCAAISVSEITTSLATSRSVTPCSASTRRANATWSGNFSRNCRRTSERVFAASANLAGNKRSTPNGLSVSVRTLRITARISSGVRPEPPMHPMPPASDTAATNSAGVALPREPMPARRIGYSIPRMSHSGVLKTGLNMGLKTPLKTITYDLSRRNCGTLEAPGRSS